MKINSAFILHDPAWLENENILNFILDIFFLLGIINVNMFKDENLESISIKSDTLNEKYVRDQSCQTRPIDFKEKSSQSVNRVTSEVQTENNSTPAQVTRLRVDTSKKLENFMLTVYPIISEQLTANIRSHAFDDYELDELNIDEEIQCVLTFKSPNEEETHDITCLTWNNIGSILASAFGYFEHNSWCTHHSYIHLWNVNRKENSAPDKVIETDNCVTSLSFHPNDPPLLLGGDFSGKIHMWDLSKEDNLLVAFTGKECESHQEAVNQVVWLPSSGSVVYFLSVGSDGNIFSWMYNKLKKHIGLLSSFQLSGDVIPRSVRKSSMRSGTAIGITCATLMQNQNKDMFIGTENGAVFGCKEKSNGYNVIAFESHKASVNAIDISKQSKTFMFASCSLDMCIHIYKEAQHSPVHKIDPLCGHLFDIKWSFIRQMLFAATSNGNIMLYQVDDDSVVLKKTTTATERKMSVNVLAINKDDRLASSDSNKMVKVWECKSP